MGSIADTIRMAGSYRAAHNPFQGDAPPVRTVRPNGKAPTYRMRGLTDSELKRLGHECGLEEVSPEHIHLMRAVESALIAKNGGDTFYPTKGP